MLKVGDYVRFTCRCSKTCVEYADKKQLLIVVEVDKNTNGVRLKYRNGKEFYDGYWFGRYNVTTEPFLGAVSKALRSARETGCRS